jgi:hypothetical protein
MSQIANPKDFALFSDDSEKPDAPASDTSVFSL